MKTINIGNWKHFREMTAWEKLSALLVIVIAIPILVGIFGVIIVVMALSALIVGLGLLIHFASPRLAKWLGIRFVSLRQEFASHGQDQEEAQQERKEDHQEGGQTASPGTR